MAVAGVYIGDTNEDVMEWFAANTQLTMDMVDHGDESLMVLEAFGDIPFLEVHCENLLTGCGHYLGFEVYDWREYDKELNDFKLTTGITKDVDIHEFVKVH